MDEVSGAVCPSILRDMSEGVLTLGLDGSVTSVNPAAERILDRRARDLLGRSFARCFFDRPENDRFNQTILDAVYDPDASHEAVVPYFTGSVERQLHVTTSFLRDEGTRTGVIAVLGDVSELTELRDAVKAMEEIRRLNGQLELRNRLLHASFGRYLSDEIVRQLLDTPDGLALGGKKRLVTVMMSDLRGFTALGERMEAHALISMLNHYLGEMTEIIERREGTIIEFIGDAILAVFGAPVPADAHAANAVAAAVEMQARMETVNAWNRTRGFPELEMGVGVHTGEVIVGNIGSEKRTKYGVIGTHVNLCGRIESYTVGGQVLISSAAREAVPVPVTVAREQKVFPKGASGPLLLSQVTAVGGPYQVSCPSGGGEPEPMAAGAPIRFSRVTEKHCEGDSRPGVLLALSEEAALLDTREPLRPYDDLRLEVGDGLFCKVTEARETGYLLRFTARPPGFSGWLAEMMKAPGVEESDGPPEKAGPEG